MDYEKMKKAELIEVIKRLEAKLKKQGPTGFVSDPRRIPKP